ncbi:hypothetical protein ROZALSC1DRAFT_29382 [Rozella allomycis CSF55]|uniref:SAM domain-containing protein n=1 Tax=Rozella allomycis (strain CSF55) TaxID=988480 RepID=A0A075AVE8_ROZAC|nr:hypothetical protein O9G_003170 [Rozella allomycis CSF55]RKP18976.1 hypothetical protein ROZALSC1DRAFT_29382 [Rozella allomycis CSF55]|eukprot:EPZ34090.1 hypothetical protein O9G_003170 [Rozella allomycis CSF55]
MIDGDVLPYLDYDYLKEIGVSKIGHCARILGEIKHLMADNIVKSKIQKLEHSRPSIPSSQSFRVPLNLSMNETITLTCTKR